MSDDRRWLYDETEEERLERDHEWLGREEREPLWLRVLRWLVR
jgi:hypothetical protein